jgi:hypothetical protein
LGLEIIRDIFSECEVVCRGSAECGTAQNSVLMER